MTNKRKIIVVFLALLVMTWQGAWAQPNCINVLMSLVPCLDYLTGGSSGPSFLCCSQLNWVIQNQPECPCALVNAGGAALGIVANQTLALTIPDVCNLENPSVSRCKFISGRTTESVGSPAIAPLGSQSSSFTPSDISSNDSPETVPRNSSPPGSGNMTVSSTTNTSSGASVTKLPFCVALLLLLVLHLSDSVLSLRYRN